MKEYNLIMLNKMLTKYVAKNKFVTNTHFIN